VAFKIRQNYAYAAMPLLTISDRAFPVAASGAWNGLRQHVTAAASLPVFYAHQMLLQLAVSTFCCAREVTM